MSIKLHIKLLPVVAQLPACPKLYITSVLSKSLIYGILYYTLELTRLKTLLRAFFIHI
jgi:hypothetical protein